MYGLPAWWFTLGAGVGCVVLATLFVRPMRYSGVETLPQYLVCTFGTPIRPLVAVSDSIGIFLTIPGQAASAISLLTVLLHWSAVPVFILVSLLVIAYVFMGGAISAGVAGFAKPLISFCCAACVRGHGACDRRRFLRNFPRGPAGEVF